MGCGSSCPTVVDGVKDSNEPETVCVGSPLIPECPFRGRSHKFAQLRAIWIGTYDMSPDKRFEAQMRLFRYTEDFSDE